MSGLRMIPNLLPTHRSQEGFPATSSASSLERPSARSTTRYMRTGAVDHVRDRGFVVRLAGVSSGRLGDVASRAQLGSRHPRMEHFAGEPGTEATIRFILMEDRRRDEWIANQRKPKKSLWTPGVTAACHSGAGSARSMWVINDPFCICHSRRSPVIELRQNRSSVPS